MTYHCQSRTLEYVIYCSYKVLENLFDVIYQEDHWGAGLVKPSCMYFLIIWSILGRTLMIG